MSEKSLTTIALGLVHAYCDDTVSFQERAKELAEYLDTHDKPELAGYVMAQFGGPCTFSTMEIDPLENITRDMFKTIEGLADEKVTREYEMRLSGYFPDFHHRVRERSKS